jgi:geranyl-CoA carboxylase alpha subunit
MKAFDTILIANRGEIALRILRTARRMGYRVIAVYSDADADAPHVHMADQAVRIGASAPRDSYLNIAAILAAAEQSRAGAIHPGYGFLAENAEFAQAVLEAGLVWIGPSPQAIEAMGDKARARQRMQAAGVPCIPGYDAEPQDDATLRTQAAQIGYPLMVKATAGGGGRGMRLVESAAQLDAALLAARSEALGAFGSDRLMLERAIQHPRHVEIQVFADDHGHVVHLGERDCSVQRRHQKLIEEAPSPALAGADGAALRRAMGAMAVAAARAIDYRGAGTIECLLDARGEFHFMEMNTRLQVEHPVTEALTGYDLVEWQLRVARGEPLPETDQQAILQRFESGGHAIEVRLCAEDPAHAFVPQSGRLLAWQAADGVRVEHALQSGQEIAPFYDAMIAKFIAHGPDRDTARRQLSTALRDSTVLGVRTNQAWLAACLAHPVFADGQADTGFVAACMPALLAANPPMPVALAAMTLYAVRAWGQGQDPKQVALPLPWPLPMQLSIDGEVCRADITSLGADRYRVAQADGQPCDMRLRDCSADRLIIDTDQGCETVRWAQASAHVFASRNGQQSLLSDLSLVARSNAGAQAQSGQVRAPMAGRIVALHVAAGQQVRKGAPLLVLEAMKMEHPSVAPMDAVVGAIGVAVGAQVAAGALLLELTAATTPSATPGAD